MPWLRPFFHLRWRLAFVYLLFVSIFVIILSGFVYTSVNALIYRNAQTAFPQRVLELRTQFLRDLCHNETVVNAAAFLEQENRQNDIDAVYVIASSGMVIASSDGMLLHQVFPALEPTVLNLFPSVAARPFQMPHAGSKTSDGFLVSLRSPQNCASTHFEGYLAATTSYSVERTTLGNLFILIGVAALVMILLGSGVIVLLTDYMLRPLRAVAAAAQAIAEGDLQQRVRLPDNHDEIGTLATSFNQMAERIEQAFQAQQESERRSQRFVSDASHELRTPITSLRGFTEVLIRGAKDDPETAQRVLAIMKNEAERMTRLVNDLLTLARLDEGRPLRLQDVDLVDIAIEGVQHAKKLADNRKVSLDLVTQERLSIQADPERLKQMLWILLDNAIKYGRAAPDSSITLRLDKENKNALIQIIDTGPGIAPEDLPRIFDRFYRGQHTPASQTNDLHVAGTGLGLAIAIAIARAHHGDITVCSELDKETIFTVTLPCPNM